ncbi:PQQ-dependent sugar dehydrogenase [Sphingobium nicotianae]|uniref:PQQ-dependent sugar dehydrogenase n=1 Tax=Sphingobium nicotianae TaxID=2782607 RepID=A0A9X1DC33_9SPHN|nr:PQQ-dependent sugar dehydrogenase [Sphingobium nicotianae]MBT2186918.1 PQQ-dependent sugar dehydrogenase [Sphingobium nicotianae]
MAKPVSLLALGGAAVLAGTALMVAQPFAGGTAKAADNATCSNDGGLSLPPGFCATIFADNVGHARQMVVAADGTLYVNTWMSQYFRTPPAAGGFLVALRDKDGDGKAEQVDRFGSLPRADGMGGGTGITIWKDGLYAEVDDKIVRYTLKPGERVPSGTPTVILDGLPMSGDHMMKPILIDKAGNLFINSGSPSNVCEKANRQPGSLGKDPCEELETRAGIWMYSATKAGQHFSAKERYASGIRNTGGLTFDSAGRLFAVQHGRDQLAQSWPALYDNRQGAELPAEELLQVNKGDNFGWPYCYYDGLQKKLVLAPEYGGDGGTSIGRCASAKPPVAAFGAHFAPTGLAYYAGGQFPSAYKGGVFISFHGSWNRAPLPQEGFRVTFQPLVNGKASAPAILFADGVTGPGKATGGATHRPTGIAVGPDGALYVSDDVAGRIWKISYKGPANAALTDAKAVIYEQAAAATGPTPLPPGFTADQVALGSRIYSGLERGGTCQGCHGENGKGSTIGPALTGEKWLWADGSVVSIAHVIGEGVTTPKQYPSGMPAKGGADLSDADVQAVAAYVWTLSHGK